MAKKKTKKSCGSKEMLLVGTKVRAQIKKKKCMVSAEFLPALSCAVSCMVDKAVDRAKANKRATLRARDL